MSVVTDRSSASGSLVATKVAFDVANEADTLQLLRTVHRSSLPVETKNDIRDAVFSYRLENSASDITTLQNLLTPHEITVTDTGAATETSAAPATPTPAVTAPGFHHRRAPVFKAPAAPVTKTPEPPAQPTPAATAPVPPQQTPVTTVPTATPEPPPAPETSSTAAAPTEPTPAPTPVAAPVTESKALPTESPRDEAVNNIPIKKLPDTAAAPSSPIQTPPTAAPVTPEPLPTPTAARTTTPEPTPVAAPEANSGSNRQERIKEIKHQINQQVGNPITLIDVDEAVGKEYMAALLDAMKQTNVDPNSTASERALSRLEKAFQAAETILKNQQSATSLETPKAAATPATPTPTTQTTQEENEQPVSSAPIAPPQPSAATDAKVAPPPTQSAQSPVSTNTAQSAPPAAVSSIQSVAEAETQPQAQTAPKAEAEGVTESNPPTPTVPTKATSPVADEPHISSPVTSSKTLAAQMAEQKAAQAAARPEPSGDPLLRDDVTKGLEQLLSEWSIFKRSGMFGTGPNGIEHPLYEELSHLTMSTVLTGRFEGVTPEVKRSINDYMNGWRYEEGIVHESGETFEHYLRRVVRHILDKRAATVDATS